MWFVGNLTKFLIYILKIAISTSTFPETIEFISSVLSSNISENFPEADHC